VPWTVCARRRTGRPPRRWRRHPSIDVDPDVLYVDNGSVLTSAGAAAAFDLCLHLIRCDRGASAAAAAARAAVMPPERAGGQAQFIVHEPPVDEASAAIRRALSWIEENLSNDLALPGLARRSAMSVRTLSRQFRAQVGMTPAAWIARARVRRAQVLLETTRLNVEQIASRCGFGTASRCGSASAPSSAPRRPPTGKRSRLSEL
jgi:transcriptional regulator GlxA family with amidase domain